MATSPADTLGTDDPRKEEPTCSASSSDWSDEEGDEYLAKALASDPYLQDLKASTKTSPRAGGPPHPDKTPAAADGEAAQAKGASNTTSTSAAAAAVRETLLVHHPLCELHSIPDHPERPGRVRAIMNALTREFPDFDPQLAPEATLDQVLRFHDRHLVDKIDRLCSLAEEQGRVAEARAAAEAEALSSDKTSGGKRSKRPPPAESFEARQRAAIMSIDPDTAVMPTSRAAIWRAAGAACFAVDEVMSGRAANAFCCVRPPGHHAEPGRAMGFCFFNNAPIGALHAQAEHGAERVAVVDIDVHHGNGTQAFFREDPTTFYASTHQGPDFYPGTGQDFIKGVSGNILNVSMREGEGSRAFRRAYSEKVLPALEVFQPGLIFISAGFDAHENDPLAGIALDEEDYHWVTREICAVAGKVCGGRVVSILEGGYNLQAISDSAVAHVRALREASAAVAMAAASALSATAKAAGSDRGGGQVVDGCLVDDGGLAERLQTADLVGKKAEGKSGGEGEDGGGGGGGNRVSTTTTAEYEGGDTATMVAAPSSGPVTAPGGAVVGFPEALPPTGASGDGGVCSRGNAPPPPPLPPRPQKCLPEEGGEGGESPSGDGGRGISAEARTGSEEDMDEAFARLSVRDAELLKEAPGDGEDVFRPS